jgi:tRNA G18 (ribose-2'-O)-methylase SpoU
MITRDKTRRERYDGKKRMAKTYPISLCCVNFQHDGNLGYLIRSAACFGAEFLHVIGSIPERKVLNPLSGSLYDYVEIKQYSSPRDFLDYTKNEDIKLVAAEIHRDSKPISSYKFHCSRPICLVVGHEESGIPIEILQNSDIVHIPMPGAGYCLNTSQTANIMLYEAIKQYEFQQEWCRQWAQEQGIYSLP